MTNRVAFFATAVQTLAATYPLEAAAQKKPDPIAYTDQKILEEATARAARDSELATDIGTEASARAAADTSLNSKLNAVTTELGQLDAADAALSQADQSLSSAFTALQTTVDGLAGSVAPTTWVLTFSEQMLGGQGLAAATYTSTSVPGYSIAMQCYPGVFTIAPSGNGWVEDAVQVPTATFIQTSGTWHFVTRTLSNPAFPTKVATVNGVAQSALGICKGQLRFTISDRF